MDRASEMTSRHRQDDEEVHEGKRIELGRDEAGGNGSDVGGDVGHADRLGNGVHGHVTVDTTPPEQLGEHDDDAHAELGANDLVEGKLDDVVDDGVDEGSRRGKQDAANRPKKEMVAQAGTSALKLAAIIGGTESGSLILIFSTFMKSAEDNG